MAVDWHDATFVDVEGKKICGAPGVEGRDGEFCLEGGGGGWDGGVICEEEAGQALEVWNFNAQSVGGF